MRTRCYSILALAGLLIAGASCRSAPEHDPRADARKATAVLTPASGSNVKGKVTFTQVDDGILVIADISGLAPGEHGFHIHEFGVCEAPDAVSAGGHFNPDKHNHGAPDAEVRHVGDLGNLVADSTGNAHYQRVDKIITLTGEHSVIGKSVIVHENVDDYTTQPTGNAGKRLACGVITADETVQK